MSRADEEWFDALEAAVARATAALTARAEKAEAVIARVEALRDAAYEDCPPDHWPPMIDATRIDAALRGAS